MLTDTEVNLPVGHKRMAFALLAVVGASIVFRERFCSSELNYFGTTQ